MQCIKEIEIAKSIDEVLTPRSFMGWTTFPDYDTLDAMMACASKKLVDRQPHFPKRVSVEEQRARNHDRFLRGRQTACMIYEYFRSTGSYDEVQHLSGLFSTRLHNDDVQDFDVRWDRAISSTSVTPSEGWFTEVKITGLCSASDHIVFVRRRNHSTWRTTGLFKFETVCKITVSSALEKQKLQHPERNRRERSRNQG